MQNIQYNCHIATDFAFSHEIWLNSDKNGVSLPLCWHKANKINIIDGSPKMIGKIPISLHWQVTSTNRNGSW